MTTPKKAPLVKRLARAITTASRDAEIARRTVNDPQFQKDIQEDRRGALSKYGTVRQALRDRSAAAKPRVVSQKKKRP